MFLRFFFFLFLAAIHPFFGMGKRSSSNIHFTSEAIGVRTLRFEDPVRKRPILVELWYPTHEASLVDEPTDQVWVHPKEMRNAPMWKSDRKHPLIIMSHGHRGDRRERSWLADVLVRQGFIVASVEHYGNTWFQYDPLISLRFWERSKDITFSLDHLLKEPILLDRVDANRIGFVGYSMGGMTGLSLAGAQAKNVKQMVLMHQERIKELKKEQVNLVDFSEAENNYREPRIQGMLLICPANFCFTEESLKQINIPVGLVVAVDDEVLPHLEHAYPLIKFLMPQKLKMLKGGISHYAFLNPLSEKGKKSFKMAPLHQEAVHSEVAAFATEFFQEIFRLQNK